MTISTPERGSPRPSRQVTSRFAAELIAKDLAARIPQFNDYVRNEGLYALSSQVYEVMKLAIGSPGPRDHKSLAEKLAAATGVHAELRTEALLGGLNRYIRQAAEAVIGRWIRETGLKPPFEGDYAEAEGVGGPLATRVVVFRTPELDAIGQVAFLPKNDERPELNYRRARFEQTTWEKLERIREVPRHERSENDGYSQYLKRQNHNYLSKLFGEEKATEIDREFAVASFKEMSDVERFAHLRDLGAALAAADEPADAIALVKTIGAISALTFELDPVPADDEIAGSPAPRA